MKNEKLREIKDLKSYLRMPIKKLKIVIYLFGVFILLTPDLCMIV